MASVDWKSIVGTVAPGLATILVGPLAGVAVGALSEKLLGKPDGTPEQVAEAITAQTSPDTLARIREAEAQLKSKLADAGVKWEEIAAQDRASARQLATTTSIKPQVVLSGIFIIGYLILGWTLLSKQIEIAESMRDIFMVLVGVLTAGVTQIMNFWFGTSSGSAQKTAILDRIANHR